MIMWRPQKYMRCAMCCLFHFSSLAIMQFCWSFTSVYLHLNAQVKCNHWRRDIRKRYNIYVYVYYVYMLFFLLSLSYILKLLYTDYVITSQEKVIFLCCFCFFRHMFSTLWTWAARKCEYQCVNEIVWAYHCIYCANSYFIFFINNNNNSLDAVFNIKIVLPENVIFCAPCVCSTHSVITVQKSL